MMRARWCVVVTALLGLFAATPARAWDPSRTHVGISERAVATSDVHRRWMEGSGQALGWFSPVRVDPNALDAATRRALLVAMRVAHADVGSIAAGGPGACPPQPAPTETLQRCVDGDVWETSALGWLRIGIALESADRTRLLHHFVDGTDPSRTTWRASGRRTSTWRRIERRAGGAAATRIGGTGFSGSSMSAIGWLQSDADPFGPAALFAHQRAAALASTRAERERHLALALVATGALLHVVQDLAMPAHARGDLLGTRVPLSGVWGDRGSPLAEYARITFGRAMPTPLELTTRTEEVAAPTSMRELLLGGAAREGLVDFAAGRFLSDGSLPPAKVIDPALDGAAAAAAWLGDGAGLTAAERDGAVLAPWPAESGYLRTKNGRALAAWTADVDGRVRGYIDRRVLREHALVLLPAAVQASVDTLELLWPLWPEMHHDASRNILELDADPALRERELAVLVQDPAGKRTLVRRVALLDGWSRVRDITPKVLPEGAHVVLAITGKRSDGQRVAIERRLDAQAMAVATPPAPTVTPEPKAEPDAEDPEDATEPEPATPEPAKPEPATPEPAKPEPATPEPAEPEP